MSVAFNGIEELVVTFRSGGVQAGQLVTLRENNTVTPAGQGVAPVGIVRNVRNGHAAVQVKGYMRLPYTGAAPGLGWTALTCAGPASLKTAETAGSGRDCLVVNVDETNKYVGLFL